MPPLKVFLSYSHRDEAWKRRLAAHLAVLAEEGMLTVWDDRRIGAGDNWEAQIRTAIGEAQVAILLISKDFLSSRFVRGTEVPLLLQQRSKEGMLIVPVIVRSCLWKEVSWLTELQVRPLDGKPLASFGGDRIDQELVTISQEVLDFTQKRDKTHREIGAEEDIKKGNPPSLVNEAEEFEPRPQSRRKAVRPPTRSLPRKDEKLIRSAEREDEANSQPYRKSAKLTRVRFVFLLVATLTASAISFCTAYLWGEGDLKEIKLNPAKIIPHAMPSGGSLSEIWFSPSGSLFATFEVGSRLNVASWDDRGRSRIVNSVDFSMLAENVIDIANPFHGGNAGNKPLPEGDTLVYSVSNDGASLVWVWHNRIFWRGIDPYQGLRHLQGQDLGSLAHVSAVAITRPGVAMIVDASDSFTEWDLIKGRPIFQVPFKQGRGPRLIWGRGSFRILSSYVDANAYVFSTQKRAYEQLPVVPGGASFAASERGTILAGTPDGIIMVSRARGSLPLLVTENVSHTMALAFYDEATGIAGGKSRVLSLVKDGATRTIAQVPEGVRLLAVSRKSVAYATSDRLMLAEVTWELAFSKRAKRWLAYLPFVVGLLIFVRFFVLGAEGR